MSAETLLNAKLRMELHESQRTVSMLKMMLKQSRLKIKELEAENYERKVEDEIEKELKLFQIIKPTELEVKQETIKPDLRSVSQGAGEVGNLVCELDSFLKRMKQTNVMEKVQDEKLLEEDLPSMRHVDTTLTLDQEISHKVAIKKEIMVEQPYSEEKKLMVAVHEVQNMLPTDNKPVKITNICHVCEEAFSHNFVMKLHMLSHRKPLDQNKPKIEFDHDLSGCTSAFDKVSKLEIRSSKQLLKKGMRKNTKGKYECIKCGHQHTSQKIVLFHVLYEHEGITWDCTLCSTKSSSPYQLKNHIKIKHKVTEKTRVKETCNKSVEIKKIQQILNGSKQKSATPKKKKEHFTFSGIKNKSSNDRKISMKGRRMEGELKKKEKKVRNNKLKLRDNDEKVIGATDIDNKKINYILNKIKKNNIEKMKPEKKIEQDLNMHKNIQKEKQKMKSKKKADAAAYGTTVGSKSIIA